MKNDYSEKQDKEEIELIKYNPLKIAVKGKDYYPALVIVKKKIYRLANWHDALRIIMFFYCYKADKISAIEGIVDNANDSNSVYYIKSSSVTQESRFSAKFSPDYYIHVSGKNINNYKLLSLINKWIGDFELYVIRKDENNKTSDYKDLIEIKISELVTKHNYKLGSTKHLIASINARTLNTEEKFYIKIGNEFDKSVLIGDISINDEEENILKAYMNKALTELVELQKKPDREKVFAYGMVRVAQKFYASKVFWPCVTDEYKVNVNPNNQRIVNQTFKDILIKYNKDYYSDIESNYVQNMCMHAFVCDKCANQLFDYIFDFWRIDLSRSIENIKDEDENDLFDVLVEEIERNMYVGVQNIMMHTTMALITNPIGCKNRLRRILKMIDNSYWNNASYANSQNRISVLFNEWLNNKDSLFYKDIKNNKETRRQGRGEKLLSRPNIQFDMITNSFNIHLPKQILRHCGIDEIPIWRISIDGDLYTDYEPELIQGKASLYTKECFVKISSDKIYKNIEIILLSDKAHYYKRSIKEEDSRFFFSNGRSVDLDYDYISMDACLAFVKQESDLKLINNVFISVEDYDNVSKVYRFDLKEEDVFILPNNHAVPVGHILKEGIIGDGRIKGVFAIYNDDTYEICSKKEKVFFKASKKQLNGTSIKVMNNSTEKFFGKIISNNYVEFYLDESIKDVYGYFIDLHEYITNDGLYTIEISIPGTSNRTYKLCYIKDFKYTFENAPYIFEDTGEISFPSYLPIGTDENWDISNDKKTLIFDIDENGKDGNMYVKNRELYVPFELPDNDIELVFELPVFYWKYKLQDNWEHIKPNDIYLKNVVDKIYISGYLNLSTATLFIENDDGLENSELASSYDNKNDVYYFRMLDLVATMNRDLFARNMYISINNKSLEFQKIICKSAVVSRNITGDFINKKIYGNYEIVGSSEYLVSIYYENKKIDDNIPVVNGRFEYDGDIQEGNYRIELFEIEDDDSGFESISYKIDEYELELVDANRIEGKSIYIHRIKYGASKFMPMQLVYRYCIKKLQKIDYYKDLYNNGNFYTWKYDYDDVDTISKFTFYTGIFGFEINGNFTKLGKGLVIFDNPTNTSEALINVLVDEEYGALIYSPMQRKLLIHDNGLSAYEKRKAKMMDDDIYTFEVEIRR